MRSALFLLLALSGCNVVPPLDCLLGVDRPGCQRDASGEYGYLYRSPITPNGKYDVPYIPLYTPPQAYSPSTIYVPPQQPRSVQTTCFRTGNLVNCQSY